MPIDPDRLVQRAGLPAQLVDPVAVADHGDSVAAAFAIILWSDDATHQRLNPEHWKILPRHQGHSAGSRLPAECNIGAQVPEGGNSGNPGVVLQTAKHLVAEDRKSTRLNSSH